MAETVSISLSDLLLDGGNPRLVTEQTGQQETALSLARQQGERLVRLADDIVKHGTDPTALVAVVAVGDTRKRYKVIEGNRRVLALKALETPSLVSPGLAPKDARRLAKLSADFSRAPVEQVSCVLFKSEDDARHWIELRHTGPNQGRGLVDWGSEEKDRFNARHSGARGPAGQVLEFVSVRGNLSSEAQASRRGVLTLLQRLLSSPEVRERIGIDVIRGEVVALYNRDAVAKSLSYVVDQLKTGKVTVPEVYHAKQRKEYAAAMPRSVVPKRKDRLSAPATLAGLTAGRTTPASGQPRKRSRRQRQTRATVIPKSAALDVTPPRINAIYNELLTLTADQYPNACSVLLRVFIELSIDHFIDDRKLKRRKNDPLAARLKMVAAQLKSEGAIPENLRKAVEQIANGPSPLAPGMSTFNQYVHNQYTHPKPSELYAAWNELQPFMEKVWP
jgi:hypothetical protein